MNPLELTKYFDAWRLLKASQLTIVKEPNVRKLAKKNKLNEDHLILIAKLIQQRKSIRYIVSDGQAREMKGVYDAYNKIPEVHNPLDYLNKPPIKKITIVLQDGQTIVLSDKTILWNVCHLGFRFFKSLYSNYFKKYYNPNARGKGKSVNLDTSNRALARQIIKYLHDNSNLQQRGMGSVVVDLFHTVGNPLPYTDGKTAYDAIMR